MRSITNPEEFRTNIRKTFYDILKKENLAKNLEVGIFNYSIESADEHCVVKKWDNIYFVELYITRFRAIHQNIQREGLLQDLMEKKITPEKLAFMTHQELDPDNWKELIEEKKILLENKYSPNIEASTDDFTCFKCKSNKCTYYQLQTRSADEPMTTFVTCLHCGNRWKC